MASGFAIHPAWAHTEVRCCLIDSQVSATPLAAGAADRLGTAHADIAL